MREIKALTTLRALAAYLVFMYHYAHLFPPASRGVETAREWIPLMSVWRSSQVGVSIFFVLSGFLITRIYYDRFASGAGGLRLYLVKRVARIWPLFLVLAAIQHMALWAAGQHPTTAWIVTCSMTQGFFRDLRYAGLPTAWSLTIEESFYLVAPVIYLAIAALVFGRHGDRPGAATVAARLGGVLVLMGVAIATSLALITIAAQRLGWTPGGFMAGVPHLFHATLGGRFPEFAVGIACAFVHQYGDLARRLRGARATVLAIACFLAIGGCMAWKSAAAAGGGGWQGYLGTYAIVLLTGLLILALSVEGTLVSRLLSGRLAVYMGRTSYGFYLIQLTVIMTPLLALSDHLGPLRLPALFVLMNLVCAVFYQLVERPARRGIVSRWGGSSVPIPVKA